MLDKNLLNMLGKDKKFLFIVTFLNIVNMLANTAISAIICYILYLAFNENKDINNYILYFGIALILLALKILCSIISSKIKYGLGNRVKKRLREEAYLKLLDLGFDNNKIENASISQLIIEGIEQIDLYYSSFIPSFFYAMISPIILFIICVCLEWKVALVLIICLPLIPMSIIMVSKWAKKIFNKYWDKYMSMGNVFLDSINGMKDLKIFNYDNKKQEEINKSAEEFRKITMKVLVMQLASLTIIDTVAFGGAGIAISFAINSASTEGLSYFITLFLVLISAEFFLPMRALASSFHVSMNGATAGRRLREFLDLEVPSFGNNSISKIDNITFNNVKFSYDGKRVVLNDVSFEFKKGLNAICGESGSGKSTTVSLVLGGNIPSSGEVLINGIKPRDYKRNELYNLITLVSYNTFIFNDSIRNNFKNIKADITDVEIYEALNKVNLKEFVESVGGLDYVILEDSENISGGQRQRLALAMNLTVKRDLYIFDEATSNIDATSEAIIMKNIKELSLDSIVILISHRLYNVINSNIIYYLDNGKLIEKGKHQELLDLKGLYSESYNKQYALENDYKEVKLE